MKKLRKISTILFSMLLVLSASFGTYALCGNVTGGGTSQSEITDEENSSKNCSNSGDSTQNVDNSTDLSTSDGNKNNTSDASGESDDTVSGDTTITDTTSYVSVDEIFDSESGTFSYDNMNQLLQYITGDSSTTVLDMTDVDSLASAADIRANVVGSKTSEQDVQVTFGGLTWQVMYISTDNDGNAILTLWLSDNYQSAWESRSSSEGEYYGYIDGALYSDWSADWSNTTAGTYPSTMYGTSYINVVTLNNGGYYAKDNATLSDYVEKSTSSAFAIFTMTQDELDSAGSSLTSLTDYLVTPRNVSWQETEYANSADTAGFTYTTSNDAYGTPAVENWYSSGTRNYTDYDYYDSWTDGYLWLPSIAETGYSSSYDGLWETSTYQRMNYDGSTTSSVGSVGSSSGSAYAHSWLRSAHESAGSYAYYLFPSGTFYTFSGLNAVSYSQAVRPSLHLNLTAAAKSASPLLYNEEKDYWCFEDDYMPQSVYGDGQTEPSDVDTSAASEAYTIRLSTSSWASVLIYSGTDDDYAYVTIYSGSNVEVASAWFVVEPIVWIVAYGEDEPTSVTSAVTAKIVTCGYATADVSTTFSWALTSVFGMSTETLESYLNLTYASVGEFAYDSFSGTLSQVAVDDDSTTIKSKIAVSSVDELDALGGSYASTCTDFVAFLLSGGASTDGDSYSADYWTRDLAATLDDSSTYYSNTNTTFTYDGALNNGIYVTKDGTLSNAKLKNCFGARLTMNV